MYMEITGNNSAILDKVYSNAAVPNRSSTNNAFLEMTAPPLTMATMAPQSPTEVTLPTTPTRA